MASVANPENEQGTSDSGEVAPGVFVNALVVRLVDWVIPVTVSFYLRGLSFFGGCVDGVLHISNLTK